jgi:hypothetical protein
VRQRKKREGEMSGEGMRDLLVDVYPERISSSDKNIDPQIEFLPIDQIRVRQIATD